MCDVHWAPSQRRRPGDNQRKAAPVFVRDTIERAVKTFVQAFLAAFTIGSAADWNLGFVKSAALAAAGMALSVVSSAISKRFGAGDSASLVR